MTIQGQTRVVKGGLLYCLADTLAAHHIGGFKVGVGFSLRKCRMSLATKDQISVNVSNMLHFMGVSSHENCHMDISTCTHGYLVLVRYFYVYSV